MKNINKNTVAQAKSFTSDTEVSEVKKSGWGRDGAAPSMQSNSTQEKETYKKPKNKRHNPQLLCKGQQFRLHPTPEQALLLRQWIGCGRFVWNWALAQQNEYSTARKTTSIQATSSVSEATSEATQPNDSNDFDTVVLHQEAVHHDAANLNVLGQEQLPKTLTVNVLSNRLTEVMKQHSQDGFEANPDQPNLAFLKKCPRTVLTNSLQHLGTAWSNFYDGVAGKRRDEPGKPVFRKRLGKNERATFQVDPRHKYPIDVDNQTVAIPGLGPVKVVLTETIAGDLSSMTVKRKGNIWLISFALINVQPSSVQRNPENFVKYPNDPTDTVSNPDKKGVGALDLSVVSGAVATTDGCTTFSLFNEAVLRSNEKHEKCKTKYQRAYSRKMEQLYRANGIVRDANGAWPKNATALLAKKGVKKNTTNMERLQEKIAVLDLHELFRKTDAIHKFTTKLVQENHTIVVETIMLNGMAKALSRGFRRRMHEACMGKIIEQLTYKCEWYNRSLIFVDKWFPSSKRCSNTACHEKNKYLLLKDREWVCTSCNTSHIRDNTAAFNLWQEGWRLLEEFFQQNDTNCLAAGSVVRGRQGVVFSAEKPIKPKKRKKSPKSLKNVTSSLVASG